MKQKKQLGPTKPAAGAEEALARNKAARKAKSEARPTTRKKPVKKSVNYSQAAENLRRAAEVIAKFVPTLSTEDRLDVTDLDAAGTTGETYKAQWIAGGLIAGFSLFSIGLIIGWFMRG